MMPRSSGRRHGQALAELAILLPVVLLLLGGTLDVALLFNQSALLAGATREGARVAAKGGTADQVASAVRAYAPSLPAQDMTVVVTPDQRVPGEQVTVEVSAPIKVLTPVMATFTGPVFTLKSQGAMRVETASP